MVKIQAVLFDYGMVLSGPPDPLARKRMENLLKTSSDLLDDSYWKFRDDYDRGTLNAAGYWYAVASFLQRDLDQQTLAALIEADTSHWTQPNQPMVSWAQRLQKANVKTGVLSNIGDAMEAGVLQRFAWMDKFSHRTFSHRLKMAKPDLAIYHYAAQGLQTSPEEILFIDDRAENIRAARTVGMVALQYKNHEAFLIALQDLGAIGLPS